MIWLTWALFAIFEAKRSRNGSKIRKTACVLEFNLHPSLVTDSSLSRKRSKSLYPNAHTPYQIYELLFLEPVTFGNSTTTRLERDKAVNLLQVELLIQLLLLFLLLLFNCLKTLCSYFRMVGADCSYDGWDLLGISYLETRIPALEQEFMLCNWLFLSSDRPIPAHDELFVSCYNLQEIPVLWQPVSILLQYLCPVTGHSCLASYDRTFLSCDRIFLSCDMLFRSCNMLFFSCVRHSCPARSHSYTGTIVHVLRLVTSV